MENAKGKVGRVSAVIYTIISLSAALAFFTAASAAAKYGTVAVYGGAVWVFVLSMIVTMPTVTPWVKKRLKG